MKHDLTQKIVRELLDYDPTSGKLIWKERDSKWFKDGYRSPQGNANIWNSLWAGKEAFTADNGDGYKSGAILKHNLKAHRLIWFYTIGRWPDEVDHENGKRDDNRWTNLKEVDNIGQGRNQKKHSTVSTSVMGVRWKPEQQAYIARITVNGKRIYLGSSKTFSLAAALRHNAEIEYGFHSNHGKR